MIYMAVLGLSGLAVISKAHNPLSAAIQIFHSQKNICEDFWGYRTHDELRFTLIVAEMGDLHDLMGLVCR